MRTCTNDINLAFDNWLSIGGSDEQENGKSFRQSLIDRTSTHSLWYAFVMCLFNSMLALCFQLNPCVLPLLTLNYLFKFYLG